jgi:hypothetical protein
MKKKRAQPKKTREADATVEMERSTALKPRDADSDDVERAIYDGMQDLRVTRPGTKRK